MSKGGAAAAAAIASAAAAVLHGVAAGGHAEHPGLSRVFLALAVAQLAVAVFGFTRAGRAACAGIGGVNLFGVAGWCLTWTTGVPWIDGLEHASGPGLADALAAALAVLAVAAAGVGLLGRSVSGRSLAAVGLLTTSLLVPGLAGATTDGHDHTDDAANDEHHHDDAHHDDAHHDDAHHDDAHHDAHHDDAHHDEHHHEEHHHDTGSVADGQPVDDRDALDDPADDVDGHDAVHDDTGHDDTAAHEDDHDEAPPGHDDTDAQEQYDETTGQATGAEWPRPWDPAEPVDLSGVPGVSAEQQARAERLVIDTLRELPAFADVNTIGELGYRSIGDDRTGFEHFINLALFEDDRFLDPTAPESLVYAVDGEDRTLVSAMFIAGRVPIDDPELTDFAGPLMQWHVHDNLCWGLDDDGNPVVMGVLSSPTDVCPRGTVNAGGDLPMVHVWITPHECGPFAALEGEGAGQADAREDDRTDLCHHGGH